MISHEQREAITIAILQALDAVHPRGMTAQSLLTPVKLSGFTLIEKADMESLMSDIEERQWVKATPSPSAAEVKRFVRTDAARVYLRDSGF